VGRGTAGREGRDAALAPHWLLATAVTVYGTPRHAALVTNVTVGASAVAATGKDCGPTVAQPFGTDPGNPGATDPVSVTDVSSSLEASGDHCTEMPRLTGTTCRMIGRCGAA
jgi:hypothetical protein